MSNKITQEQLTTINKIICDVRQEYDSHNCLGGVFADHCDAVSEIVLMVMENHGFAGGYLVSGYYSHAYPDSETDQYGHTWIEWEDLIIDPTRCQFDNHDFVVSTNENHLYKN